MVNLTSSTDFSEGRLHLHSQSLENQKKILSLQGAAATSTAHQQQQNGGINPATYSIPQQYSSVLMNN